MLTSITKIIESSTALALLLFQLHRTQTDAWTSVNIYKVTISRQQDSPIPDHEFGLQSDKSVFLVHEVKPLLHEVGLGSAGVWPLVTERLLHGDTTLLQLPLLYVHFLAKITTMW